MTTVRYRQGYRCKVSSSARARSGKSAELVTEKLAKSNPQAVKEIYRLLLQAKTAAELPKAGAIDFLAFGLKACRPALQTIITYALQQRLIPRKIEVEELFDDTTRALD